MLFPATAPRQFPATFSLLREFIFFRFNEANDTCGSNVEKELLFELDDGPKTITGTKLSVLQ